MKQDIVKVSWSGGKDSTCALMKHIEAGHFVKAVCYIPMFTETIPLISKEHYEWIIKTADYFRSLGADVHIVSGITYEQFVYKRSSRGQYKGRPFGFPPFQTGWCSFKRDSKIKALAVCDVGYFDYEDIGIAFDETARHNQLTEKKRSILCEQGITEKDAREYDIERGLLSPHYKYNSRDGCSLCPNSKEAERARWFHDYPEAIPILYRLQNFVKKTRPEQSPLRKHQWFLKEEVLTPYIFDCEVFSYDWVFVFKEKLTGEYTVFHNDNDGIIEFMRYYEPLLVGFNNKHYDQFILKAVLSGCSPEEIKAVNDFIIVEGNNGWEHPLMSGCKIFFDQYDLMDDMQMGLSLKAIEAHLGMDITETTVDFNIDRPLTPEEREEVIYYCKADVDATDKLDDLRQDYLKNKIKLGQEKGIPVEKALYMTNAKLTAAYLDAHRETDWTDARNYQYPPTLKKEYIPQEVFDFFERLHDKSIPDDEIFTEKLSLMVGDCPCTIAYGGIHGAIPCYTEEATETRSIRNKDVASYYPHQMILNGYCSRNIPSPETYKATIERRVAAKRAGDKATANALKLVLNTTYGAMLNQFNELYDPLMGRSVCISGQLQLLELTEHLVKDCPSLKVLQLNTDGIMVSLDNADVPKYQEITQEWQDRTGFELEEDLIKKIVQRDVNNYVEVPFKGDPKIKGGVLVRGISTAGAFNINNNATVVARAVKNYLAYGIPVEKTVNSCHSLLGFQFVAKAGSKFAGAFHFRNNEYRQVQNCNRVYACKDYNSGTIYKKNKTTGNMEKIAELPAHCAVDNSNDAFCMDELDRDFYIRLAKKYVNDFLGIQPPKRNTRAVNKLKKNLLSIL